MEREVRARDLEGLGKRSAQRQAARRGDRLLGVEAQAADQLLDQPPGSFCGTTPSASPGS